MSEPTRKYPRKYPRRYTKPESTEPVEGKITYPTILVQPLEGAVAGAQFFPTQDEYAMTVGYTVQRFSARDKVQFDRMVREHAEVFPEHRVPEWQEDGAYVVSYFGQLWGPMDGQTDDELYAECIDMMQQGFANGYTITDKR